MDGYIEIARGSNMCGISMSASYPTGATSSGPSPKPPAPSPAPSKNGTHYSDPFDGGCLSDEMQVQVQGISGEMCAPSCSLISPCPSDIPDGVTAAPQCALQDASSNKKYCALLCSPNGGDATCGAKASCKKVQLGTGVCTYDS